jgi:hypothetical protein
LRIALWIWLLILGGQFLFNSYQVWFAPRKEAVSRYQFTQHKSSDASAKQKAQSE